MIWIIYAHTINFAQMMGFSNPNNLYPPNGVLASVTFQYVLGTICCRYIFLFKWFFIITYFI